MVSVQSTSKTSSDEPDGLVNHLPDELCVDVTAPRGSDPKRLYEQARAALNRHLQSEAQRLTVERLNRDGLSKIARDVEPSTLRELDGDALQPLVRSRVGATGTGARRPWVALPATGKGRRADHWHFYYQVGPQRVSFSRRQVVARRRAERRARELINLLNLSAQGLIDTPRGPAGSWSLSGSQANWLTSSLPFSCGSPAGLPVGESKKPGQFRFGPAMNAALAEAGTSQRARVVVAVLDTCPVTLDAGKNPDLKDLLDNLTRHDRTVGLPREYFDPPEGVPVYANACLPWWRDDMPNDDAPPAKFAMADHGIFVSSIVHAIAPEVELHLVRVLNDFGVGDVLALEQVLRALPDALEIDPRGNRRLILNLSLGSAVPVPGRRFFGRWLPDTYGTTSRGRPDERSRELLRRAHGGLSSTMQSLSDQGVLVVAAAGNDALRTHHGGIRPQPRFPAYYEPVLSVAAADAAGQPATYSNRGDVNERFNGLTTFGGSVEARARSEARTEVGSTDGRQKSIVGLYSSPTLPGGAKNKTGWVHWSGTSFATPIVSALAARLWQQDAGQTPHELIARLRACAQYVPGRGYARRPDPDGALDAPYLEAWQEAPAR